MDLSNDWNCYQQDYVQDSDTEKSSLDSLVSFCNNTSLSSPCDEISENDDSSDSEKEEEKEESTFIDVEDLTVFPVHQSV
uniref:Uncharacterized protein n=1 Tax=Amphimedon queenslandica TaxID=400682 RepID=A0A1X7VHJ2_AMPQE